MRPSPFLSAASLGSAAVALCACATTPAGSARSAYLAAPCEAPGAILADPRLPVGSYGTRPEAAAQPFCIIPTGRLGIYPRSPAYRSDYESRWGFRALRGSHWGASHRTFSHGGGGRHGGGRH